MEKLRYFLRLIKPYHLGLIILFCLVFVLRFYNLSYSEFQDDEKKARIRLYPGESRVEFFLRQRKGPMQFIVSELPLSFTHDPANELAQRLPFSIASFISVFLLYFLIYKLINSHFAAFLCSLLFSVNGFLVGFGRIAQYQDLNTFFSFTALVFYSLLAKSEKHLYVYSYLAGASLALSFLSHWDSIYYLPLVAYLVFVFLIRKDIDKSIKTKASLFNIGIFLILFLPFLIPYLYNLVSVQEGNMAYLTRRVGIEGSNFTDHLAIFRLYNPFVTEYVYLVGLILSIFFIKRTYPFLAWFIIDFLLIKFFMVTPNTHIYNYFIPLIVSAGLGFYFTFSFINRIFKPLGWSFALAIFISFSFLFYQSYILFVDHDPEYPWYAKKVYKFQTTPLNSIHVVTFGFPHYRAWKEVGKLIPNDCMYITNEGKAISQIYLESDWGVNDSCYYIVSIRKPFYPSSSEPRFAGLKSTKRMFEYKNQIETVTTVYKMK